MLRRSFLRGLFALPFVGGAAKYAYDGITGDTWEVARPNFSDIVEATIRSRSATLAANMNDQNVLLARLKKANRKVGSIDRAPLTYWKNNHG